MIFSCLFKVKNKREKYVKERLTAIESVRPHVIDKNFLSSKTNALRCIKRFEAINGVEYNYKSISHLCRVAGGGHHEDLFRKLNRILRDGKYDTKTIRLLQLR